MELGEGIKKLLLAGIGTAAVTAEKSKEVLDELVKKGELTVEQGKVLNQELKHNIKESVKKNVNVTLKPSNPDELKEVLGKMTPDQLAALKEQISKMQAKDVDAEETARRRGRGRRSGGSQRRIRGRPSGISNNIFRKRNSIALFKKCSRKS
ncbi:MAG: phasin family protein [Holdemanella porci]